MKYEDKNYIYVRDLINEGFKTSAGYMLPLYGKINDNPIVIIEFIGRTMNRALIGKASMSDIKEDEIISDSFYIKKVPGYPKIRVYNKSVIHRHNGVWYTMVSSIDKNNKDFARAIWLDK